MQSGAESDPSTLHVVPHCPASAASQKLWIWVVISSSFLSASIHTEVVTLVLSHELEEGCSAPTTFRHDLSFTPTALGPQARRGTGPSPVTTSLSRPCPSPVVLFMILPLGVSFQLPHLYTSSITDLHGEQNVKVKHYVTWRPIGYSLIDYIYISSRVSGEGNHQE